MITLKRAQDFLKEKYQIQTEFKTKYEVFGTFEKEDEYRYLYMNEDELKEKKEKEKQLQNSSEEAFKTLLKPFEIFDKPGNIDEMTQMYI